MEIASIYCAKGRTWTVPDRTAITVIASVELQHDLVSDHFFYSYPGMYFLLPTEKTQARLASADGFSPPSVQQERISDQARRERNPDQPRKRTL
jgi:hypothetical protein